MDTLNGIEKLARQAREEKTPRFDVADRVLQQIRAEETEIFSFTVFDLFATASAVVASVVGYFSIGAWRFIASPLMQFFAPLQEVRLW
jgi:hypothetical protein